MELEQRIAYDIWEVEMIGASALIEAEELLDREGLDYFRGFLQGYSHCLTLANKFEAITSNEELL